MDEEAHGEHYVKNDAAACHDGETVEVTIEIDTDIIARFEALGPDWRERMAAAIHEAAQKL